MSKRLGNKTNRKPGNKKPMGKNMEVLPEIKTKEPVVYAFKIGTNIQEEFYTWEEAAKFFRVTTQSIYVRACNKDSNIIGLKIKQKWLVCNADYKRSDLQERWCGLVAV